jgi:hypothetical protein
MEYHQFPEPPKSQWCQRQHGKSDGKQDQAIAAPHFHDRVLFVGVKDGRDIRTGRYCRSHRGNSQHEPCQPHSHDSPDR